MTVKSKNAMRVPVSIGDAEKGIMAFQRFPEALANATAELRPGSIGASWCRTPGPWSKFIPTEQTSYFELWPNDLPVLIRKESVNGGFISDRHGNLDLEMVKLEDIFTFDPSRDTKPTASAFILRRRSILVLYKYPDLEGLLYLMPSASGHDQLDEFAGIESDFPGLIVPRTEMAA